jgi:hypothetical protein
MADVTCYSELGSEVRREAGLVVWRMSADTARFVAAILANLPEKRMRPWWAGEADGLRMAARLVERDRPARTTAAPTTKPEGR